MSNKKNKKLIFGLRKFDIGVVVTIFLTIAGSIFYLGGLNERVYHAHVRMDGFAEQMDKIYKRLDKQIDVIENTKRNAILQIQSLSERQEEPEIFINGHLTSGLNMGVHTSNGMTNWVSIIENQIKMKYPNGQSWGTTFITVGQPSVKNRASRNFSAYQLLSLELKGETGGEYVFIGLKDNTDPDNGSETKIRIPDLSQNWKTYKIELSRFRTADLSRLYVVTEFVFDKKPQTVYARNIRYLN